MFCPKCKTEYRKGFTICADCKVSLTYKLPPAPPEVQEWKSENEQYSATDINLADFVLLKIFTSSIEVNLACGLLEGAGVEVYVTSEGVGHISGRRSAPAATHTIYVHRKDLQLGEELLKMPIEDSGVGRKETRTEKVLRRVMPLGLAAFFLMIANLPMKPKSDPYFDARYFFIGLAICFVLIFYLTFIRKKMHQKNKKNQ